MLLRKLTHLNSEQPGPNEALFSLVRPDGRLAFHEDIGMTALSEFVH